MQALGHCRVARRRVTHPMPTLMSNWKAIECRHWSTEKSSNACIGRQWSKTMQALADNGVKQYRHWPTMKSLNAGIELLFDMIIIPYYGIMVISNKSDTFCRDLWDRFYKWVFFSGSIYKYKNCNYV